MLLIPCTKAHHFSKRKAPQDHSKPLYFLHNFYKSSHLVSELTAKWKHQTVITGMLTHKNVKLYSDCKRGMRKMIKAVIHNTTISYGSPFNFSSCHDTHRA